MPLKTRNANKQLEGTKISTGMGVRNTLGKVAFQLALEDLKSRDGLMGERMGQERTQRKEHSVSSAEAHQSRAP